MPAIHSAAILNDAMRWTMQVTMLLAGLLLFHVVFDPRDPPKNIGIGSLRR